MAEDMKVSKTRMRKLDWGSGVHDVGVKEMCDDASLADIGIGMIGGMVEIEVRDM
jgi:hypothetical protein